MSVPAGSGAAPSQPKSQVRTPRTIKTYDYTLTIPAYPSGFSQGCQEVNPSIWLQYPGSSTAYDPTASGVSSQVGGSALNINLGPSCGLAHTGDSIHVQLTVRYGTPRFIAGSGNFRIDSVDDSGSDLVITDNTTGVSSQLTVYVSW